MIDGHSNKKQHELIYEEKKCPKNRNILNINLCMEFNSTKVFNMNKKYENNFRNDGGTELRRTEIMMCIVEMM